jgi:autotransporter-associated beta strand protein
MSNQYPQKVKTSASTRRLLGLFGLIAASAIPAYAQTTLTWANTGSDPKLNASWVGNPSPGNSSSNATTGNIWSFSNTAAGNNAVTLTSTRNIFGIGFTSTANAYTISGNFALSTGATGITNNSATNTQTITSPVSTGSSQTWTTVAGGTLSVDSVTITSSASNRTLTIDGAGNTSIGSISTTSTGVGSLTKTGAGTLTLTGLNTYTGATTISQGTVNITSGNSFGGSFTLDGSTGPILKLSTTSALSNNATLVGASGSANTGTLDLAVAGTYNLGTYSTNNMKFTASSGGTTTLNFRNNSVMNTSTGGAKTLTNVDSNLTIAFAGTLDISSSAVGATTFAGAGNTTVSGAIFNSTTGTLRGVTKTGTGTLTLAGVNTYNGDTTISGGKLALTGSGSIASSPTITNNATFDVSAVTGGNYTLGSTQTYKGSGTTIGNLTINGAFTPGTSPGLATFNNNLTLGSSSTTTMEIGGLGGVAGTDYDKVSVTGALTYGGGLSVVAYNSYNFAQAASFNLFGAGSRSGNFSSVSVAGTSLTNSSGVWSATTGGYDYTFSTSDGNLVIATAVPEPAASAAIGGAALLGLAALRRRRRA